MTGRDLPVQGNGLLYTDLAFEQARETYIRRTVEIALLLIAANGLWWAFFAFSFRAWPMVYVDVLGSSGALLIYGIARARRDLPASILSHLAA